MSNPDPKPLHLIEGTKLNEWFNQGIGWCFQGPIGVFTQITICQKYIFDNKIYYQVEVEEHPVGIVNKSKLDITQTTKILPTTV